MSDSRQEGLLLLSVHCVLNPFAKVRNEAREALDLKPLLRWIAESEIGLIQLPCPETHMYGLQRWGHVYDQFDTPFFRRTSGALLRDVVAQICDYRKQGYRFLGVLGMDGSPSCGANFTCRGAHWGGEIGALEELPKADYAAGKGVFLEELEQLLAAEGIRLPFFGIRREELEKLMGDLRQRYDEMKAEF